MPLPFLHRGRRAERRAARLLRRRGYRILARNLRCGRHEIDILARRGALLVVVEVRYRSAGLLAADLSVGSAKVRSLRAAYGHLRRSKGLPRETAVRFDVVLVGPGGPPEHLPGALDRAHGGR